MDNIKNDSYYVKRVLDDLDFIIQNMKGMELESFAENIILQDSMMFRLIQISENTRKLSDEYKEQHSAIPWTAISGLRNRIVHDYGNVNLTIVHDTLIHDIPDLMDIMRTELDEKRITDIEK